jgi:hypothetical protein
MRNAPSKIEQLVSGKYYFTAVKTLNSSMKIILGDECKSIGALEEVKKRLESLKEVSSVCSLLMHCPKTSSDSDYAYQQNKLKVLKHL